MPADASVRFLAPARRELMRAALWYDTRSAGLGDRLLEDVRGALVSISTFPHAYPQIDGPYRKFLLSVFPYALIYRYDDPLVFVVAVAHVRRRPGYWKRRSSSAV